MCKIYRVVVVTTCVFLGQNFVRNHGFWEISTQLFEAVGENMAVAGHDFGLHGSNRRAGVIFCSMCGKL